MRYRAKVSFSGLVSMAKGEVKEILDSSIVNDLLKAGYIEKAEEEANYVAKAVRKKTPKK